MKRNEGTKVKIGLALSGGTLKAAAHVGVLEALEELGVHPDWIAGTSAGSLVAALYAYGYRKTDFGKLVDEFPGIGLVDYGFPILTSVGAYIRHRFGANEIPVRLPRGVVKGRKFHHYVTRLLDGMHPSMPFCVVATDLWTGEPIVFSDDERALREGFAVPVQDVASVIAGSCALPGVMSPVQVGDYALVDGAFRHYVPVDVLRQMGCDKIIAVNLYRLDPDWKPATVFHVLVRSFEILLQESIDNEVDGSNLFLIQPDVSQMTWASIDKLATCRQHGYEAVHGHSEALRRFLSAPARVKVNVGSASQRTHTSTAFS